MIKAIACDKCDKRAVKRGKCEAHYRSAMRSGALKARPRSLSERLRAYSRDDGECRVWSGSTTRGYGSISVSGRKVLAHRAAWMQERGAIPDGLVIDHLCHNPGCIKVAHLAVVTQDLNMQNMRGAKRTSVTGFRGVFKVGKRYRAQVRHQEKLHDLGYFATADEANDAALAARLAIFEHSDLSARAVLSDGTRKEAVTECDFE